MRSAPSSDTGLPRLAYVADVPVESSFHGSALLFRLLQRWPEDHLVVVEAGTTPSLPLRRLPDVRYEALPRPGNRWLNTRFHRGVSSWFTLRARSRSAATRAVLRGFEPQAILTVAHGYSWLTAAELARSAGLPLHLIVHDDWPRIAKLMRGVDGWLDRQFGEIYRSAASRLCISPYMIEEYSRRYGAEGTLLLPSRAVDAVDYLSPPERLGVQQRPLTFGFGGTVNSRGYAEALRLLSEALKLIGAELLLYGPISKSDASKAGLLNANVKLKGLVPAADFVQTVREEVDVLYVPQSFDAEDRSNTELAFPSKLAEYSAAGLPILIVGPPYASSVRWARLNEGVAVVVDSRDLDSLTAAVAKLGADPAHRARLGCRALKASKATFSHATAEQIFCKALQQQPAGASG